MKSKSADLIGHTFGRLRVISETDKNIKAHSCNCICECGTACVVNSYKILSKHTKSCGCLLRDVNTRRNTTHGLRSSPEYSVWAGMLQRCYNTNDVSYKRYGAMGITICPEWKRSFETFFADMGARPSSKHQIDRIDNAKGYQPGNCRWATHIEQSRNRSVVKVYSFKGIEGNLPELAEKFNIPYDTLRRRIDDGWTIERSLTQPVRRLLGRAEFSPSSLNALRA